MRRAADVRAMPITVAKDIYRTRYAAPLRFDELPPGVDYAVLDYGINSGIARSAKVLQRLVGATVDGEIGEETLAAVRARDPKVLVAAICDERLAFLQGLRTWPTFGRGWGTSRCRGARRRAGDGGRSQGVQPIVIPPPLAGEGGDTRLDRGEPVGTALARAHERDPRALRVRRSADNPAIVGMAKACGGKIARSYKHDATPWCALTVNYCLVASGLPGK